MGKPKGLQEYPWQWGYDAALLGHTSENPYDESKPEQRAQWAEGYGLGLQIKREQEGKA